MALTPTYSIISVLLLHTQKQDLKIQVVIVSNFIQFKVFTQEQTTDIINGSRIKSPRQNPPDQIPPEKK